MNFSADELLFYGGIIVAVLSCSGILLYILISGITETKIKTQIIKEYGEPRLSLKEKK